MAEYRTLSAIETIFVNSYMSLNRDVRIIELEDGRFRYMNTVSGDYEDYNNHVLLIESIYEDLERFNKDGYTTSVMDCMEFYTADDLMQYLMLLPSNMPIIMGCGGYVAPNNDYLVRFHNGNMILLDNNDSSETDDCMAFIREMFPTEFLVTFGADDFTDDYSITVEASDKSEAIKEAIKELEKREVPNLWNSVQALTLKEAEAITKADAERMTTAGPDTATECFYSGGGIWCTVYQLSGKMSDYYYGFGSEDENGFMCLFSHSADKECNNDEYAFYGVVRYIDINTATEAEKAIYYTMAECEEKTLKENGSFSEAYKR